MSPCEIVAEIFQSESAILEPLLGFFRCNQIMFIAEKLCYLLHSVVIEL